MQAAGITVKALAVPSADLYTKYMYGKSTATAGNWDIGMVGWGSDWYGGGAAISWFNPLYSCAAVVPNGSNYTYYCSKSLDSLVQKAMTAPASSADQLWAQADQMLTNAATTYQVTQDLQPNYHSSFVHNAVYVPALQNFDPTNVWLSSPSA
jgi:peptide/nickel transport system substrate-binding protein